MNRFVIAVGALSLMSVAALVTAQTQKTRPLQDEVPPAALLTERGKDLAERLKWLRRSEFNMGPKHPSLPEVRRQIEGVKQQLKAWAPAPGANTLDGQDLKRAIPKMNDEDLRQLVVQLTEEMATLKKRVDRLESLR